ncbi:MAG: sugar phosphate isomerase/epimerase [Verrucomicrobia bacterium]|nr:sugar phosphate isomerase/epimerase [Verrucomicrobiota bacterium]
MRDIKVGIQLYTVREPLQLDFEGTLQKLAEMGVHGVELAFFYGGLEPDALAKLMKKLKMEVCGIYEGFDNLCHPDGKVYEYARALGCKYLTSGLGLPAFKDDFAGCVAKFKKACAVAGSKGMTICYHAHAHEFAKIDGEYIMDKILAAVPGMAFEADTAWIKCGGADPAGYIKKHLNRIPLVHFKDVKADKTITELGNGVVDFPAVLRVIRGSKVGWISYEQDSTALTPLESTKISMDYLKKIL